MRKLLVFASLMVLVAIGAGFQTDPNLWIGSPQVYHGACQSGMTNGSTTALPGLGVASSGTCVSAVNLVNMGDGAIIPKDCTLRNLYAASGTAGASSGDGVVKVQIGSPNGAATATALTCTIGTGKTCSDTDFTHATYAAAGQMLVITVTGAATTSVGFLSASVACS